MIYGGECRSVVSSHRCSRYHSVLRPSFEELSSCSKDFEEELFMSSCEIAPTEAKPRDHRGTLMKVIDGRELGASVKSMLGDAATSGGAAIDLSDNLRVIVIDSDLWKYIETKIPDFSETLKTLSESRSKG
jgi:hypothetical protein